jgi:hypothetical protein
MNYIALQKSLREARNALAHREGPAMTDKQLSELEKAFQDARRELISNAEKTYATLARELQKLTERANTVGGRVRDLRERMLGQAQRAAEEGSRAAANQVKRIEKVLGDTRRELDAIRKDRNWVRNELSRARDYVLKASGIEQTLARFEREWEKSAMVRGRTARGTRKTTARKAATRKAGAKKAGTRKTTARKAATRKKASKRPAARRTTKKTASRKKAASRPQTAARRKAGTRKPAAAKKTTTGRRGSASKKKAASSKKKAAA